MDSSTCPSCGGRFPVRTRAMQACPHCGRPLDGGTRPHLQEPPPWLEDATSQAGEDGAAVSADSPGVVTAAADDTTAPTEVTSPSAATGQALVASEPPETGADPRDGPEATPEPAGDESATGPPPGDGGAPSPAERSVDPLAGWDSAPAAERDGGPGGPSVPDGLVVVAAVLAGAAVGAIVVPDRRAGAATIAGLVCLAGAMAARRTWRIDPPDGTWARTVTQSRST